MIRANLRSGPATLWDMDRPSLARFADALLGGHDHYGCDRALLQRLLTVAPYAREVAHERRRWQLRVLRHLIRSEGVDQFLDLGCGMPTTDNTHQIAQRLLPGAQVVYVDHDPVVQVHGRAVLEENECVHVTGPDLTDPGATLGDPIVYRHLDFERPVVLLLCDVLHHVPRLEHAQYVVRSYIDQLAPGSFVLITHDRLPPDKACAALARDLDRVLGEAGLGSTRRDRAGIVSLFTGLELIEPGVVPLHEWWPCGPRLLPVSHQHLLSLGGVAAKR
ncbi:S-adenosyl methyltransferase [Amycolatopsis sulphurea]|uniref:S-adenosyl methyltransferase n=2 Tax=Amycolatopsis sulphurea TaxID=76022 RepID=A0A2A9FHP9_9PSEU|nr:S-adenosyl methyltransferase [Amycolatopsis sulphurea]